MTYYPDVLIHIRQYFTVVGFSFRTDFPIFFIYVNKQRRACLRMVNYAVNSNIRYINFTKVDYKVCSIVHILGHCSAYQIFVNFFKHTYNTSFLSWSALCYCETLLTMETFVNYENNETAITHFDYYHCYYYHFYHYHSYYYQKLLFYFVQ